MRITPLGLVTKTAARGEAVDFDKVDNEGRPNPYHGWTLDFPEHVPQASRTYGNKAQAQGWYDDPENEPLAPGTKWGGTGDYADMAFHNATQRHNVSDPNREEMLSEGLRGLGEYPTNADLNEYHEYGYHLQPGNQTGYPEGFSDSPLTEQRGVYADRPDLNPWPGMEHDRDRVRTEAPGRRYVTPQHQQPSTSMEGHNHELHDDAHNLDRVFGMWHGGHSYSWGDPRENMESFPSLDHARLAVEARYHNASWDHGGERTAYDPVSGTHHLVNNHRDASLGTPNVDRDSYMEIYHAEPHMAGGWTVHTDDEPQHHIWLNGDGDAVVGRERGDYGPEYDHDDDDEWDDVDVEEQGSHPEQHHLVSAGFEYKPHEYNGDKYTREDHNGHTHVIRAPNPSYGSMDSWHYEFHPQHEGDRDPNAPDASRDGPRSLSFRGTDPEQAYNLHQNLSNDLSELASRGWGTHEMNLGPAGVPGDPRRDNRSVGYSNHSIEARRRRADDSGYDRIVKTPQGMWAAHHVPDPTPENGFPHVLTIAQGRSRRDVLDQADRHDARYLTART